MKKFNRFEITTIKRTAQNVNPYVVKKAKILAEMQKLDEELKSLNDIVEQYEAPIRTMTGGFTTEDLVEKVIETTNAVDKNGRPIKITKYVFKYPDTIVPMDADIDEVYYSNEIENECESQESDSNSESMY